MNTTDTISGLTGKSRLKFNETLFEEHILLNSVRTFEKFKKITRYYSFFHIIFFSSLVIELLFFLVFFPFFAKSSILAFSLASIFLTGFSYCVLIFYFQAKKPEQFLQLRKEYIESTKADLPFEPGMAEYHLSLSHAATRVVSLLHKQETNYYPYLANFPTLSSLLKKFSIWCHWKDVFKMKELMLFLAINEHIQLIKSEPTDLEAHASLADTYCILSKLYMDPNKFSSSEQMPWVPPAYYSEEMQQKFKTAAERAIEELKILDDYAPNDQWIHAQLAGVYHDLEMPQQEIHEYEKMLKITPSDRQILYRLGILYFQQGYNAKGLRIYEQLKKSKDKKSEDLISYYDSSIISDYSLDAFI